MNHYYLVLVFIVLIINRIQTLLGYIYLYYVKKKILNFQILNQNITTCILYQLIIKFFSWSLYY